MKTLVLIILKNRNRRRFVKQFDKADMRTARLKGAENAVFELRKKLVVNPTQRVDHYTIARLPS